jgi:hypothetical protein
MSWWAVPAGLADGSASAGAGAHVNPARKMNTPASRTREDLAGKLAPLLR